MAIIRGNVQFDSPRFPAAALLTHCMQRETGLRVRIWDGAANVQLKFHAHNTDFISHLSKVWLSAVSHWHIFQYSAIFLVTVRKKKEKKIFFLNYAVFHRLDGIV